MKQLLFKFNMLLITLFSCITSQAYNFCVDGIYYNIISDYGLTVEVTYKWLYYGQGWTQNICEYVGDIVIPETVTYNGRTYKVTRIGEDAFSTGGNNEEVNGYYLKSITLPNTIESIGEDAFYNCNALRQIIIPSTVTKIEAYAFGGCINLKRCIVLSKKAVIGNRAFPTSCEIYVNNSSSDVTQNYWTDYKDQIKDILLVENTTFTYTGKNPEIDIKCNLDGFQISTENIKVNSTAGNHIGNVDALFLSVYQDYSFKANLDFDYTINKAKLNIKVDDKEREYGEENPVFTYSLSGFVNGEDVYSLDNQPQLLCSATKLSSVGNYNITPSLDDKNYEIANASGTLTITKAPLSIIVNDYTRTYGSTSLYPNLSYIGLKNNESYPQWKSSHRYSTDATQGSSVGEYSLTIGTAEATNYKIENITPGTLTITKAPLTIRASNTSRMYYEENPNFTFECIGLKNYENTSILKKQPILTTDATILSDCGDYAIYVSDTDADNYTITYQQGKLTISPRTLSVYIDDCERCYREENPAFTVTYQGFVNNEDESVLLSLPQIVTYADINSDTGTYTLKPSGASAKNYKFQYNYGTLTIKPADQTIKWDQNFDNIPIVTQIELAAVSSSGLEVKYLISNEDIAQLYKVGGKYYVDSMGEGTVQIRAYAEGNWNYNATQRLSKTLRIVSSNSSSTDGVLGDVNGDGKVTMADANIIVNMVLGK